MKYKWQYHVSFYIISKIESRKVFSKKKKSFCTHYANFGTKPNFPQSSARTSFFHFLIVTRYHCAKF